MNIVDGEISKLKENQCEYQKHDALESNNNTFPIAELNDKTLSKTTSHVNDKNSSVDIST